MHLLPIAAPLSRLYLPLFDFNVPAGFPSPAQDYVEKALDLNELCIHNPSSTYFVRVEGDSMIEAGIFSGDVLIVDRSVTAKHGDIVIAGVFGELTVKKIELQPQLRLVPMNQQYAPIIIDHADELEIYGVVRHAVRSF